MSGENVAVIKTLVSADGPETFADAAEIVAMNQRAAQSLSPEHEQALESIAEKFGLAGLPTARLVLDAALAADHDPTDLDSPAMALWVLLASLRRVRAASAHAVGISGRCASPCVLSHLWRQQRSSAWRLHASAQHVCRQCPAHLGKGGRLGQRRVRRLKRQLVPLRYRRWREGQVCRPCKAARWHGHLRGM